jgi:tetratricopeptide (TPR) repeat protein
MCGKFTAMGSWAQVYDVIIAHSKPGEPDKEVSSIAKNGKLLRIVLISFFSVIAGAMPSSAFDYTPELNVHNFIAANCAQPFLSPDLIIQDCAAFVRVFSTDDYFLPEISKALFFMATSFVRKNDATAAAKYFGLALETLRMSFQKRESESRIPELLDNSCWIKAISGIQLATALADCDRALSLKPNYPDCLDARAFALFRLKKYEDSLTAYDTALNANTNNSSALFMRGVVELELGREQAGDIDLRSARKIEPQIDKLYAGYKITVQ